MSDDIVILLRSYALEIDAGWPEDAAEEIERLRDENTRLRAALSHSDLACVYCTLPKDEWSKCQHGFPCCARMDDAMGCPELGAAIDAHHLRAEVEWLRAALGSKGDEEVAEDLRGRLEDLALDTAQPHWVRELADLALRRQDALAAEVERLRAALDVIYTMPHSDTCATKVGMGFHACDCHVGIARAALDETEMERGTATPGNGD